MASEKKTNVPYIKEHADFNKYFGFFEKHLPVLANDGEGKKIALLDLTSTNVEHRIIRRYPKAEFHVISNISYEGANDVIKSHNDIIMNLCKKTVPNAHVYAYSVPFSGNMYDSKEMKDMMSEYNINDMKFDVVVGNPPYDKQKHIKILEKTTHMLNNDGKIIWLAPINKWQEAVLFEKEKPVKDTYIVEKFDMLTTSNLFNINIRCDVGIISNFGNNIENIVDNYNLLHKLYCKLSNCELLSSLFTEKMNTYSLGFCYGATIAGNGGKGKGCYRLYSTKANVAFSPEHKGHTRYLDCNSEQCRNNIWKMYSNVILRYIYKEFGFGSVPYSIIPSYEWFQNIKKKDVWETEDFIEFFELTNEDVNIIYDAMKVYLLDYEDEEIKKTISLMKRHLNEDTVK